MLRIAAISIGWLIGLGLVLAWFLALARRQQARRRVQDREAAVAAPTSDVYELGRLEAWLYRARYRRERALFWFTWISLAALLVGAAAGVALWQSGLVTQLAGIVQVIPGGVGDLFTPLVHLLPWVVAIEVATLPLLIVHTQRQRIILMIEQDLPLVLDLLATLSEAGLAFDAAVQRVVAALPGRRPLRDELLLYLTEVLAGRRRSAALARLGWRTDVLSVSLFTSAVIHADQVGAGMTSVLRRQADDLRERRRERALAHALSTQVRMIIPMITCFLPGVFVISLGPIFFRFFQMAESMLGRYGF